VTSSFGIQSPSNRDMYSLGCMLPFSYFIERQRGASAHALKFIECDTYPREGIVTKRQSNCTAVVEFRTERGMSSDVVLYRDIGNNVYRSTVYHNDQACEESCPEHATHLIHSHPLVLP
jgi:hypothetical protein